MDLEHEKRYKEKLRAMVAEREHLATELALSGRIVESAVEKFFARLASKQLEAPTKT